MNTKLIFMTLIIVLFIGVTVFIAAVNAENLNLLSSKRIIAVTLKNEADLEKSKIAILNIPQIKIIKTIYRDKEWSKMVNKMDLPNMENPFKNEFFIKINKKADINDVLNKIKEMSFVEKAEYVSDEQKALK